MRSDARTERAAGIGAAVLLLLAILPFVLIAPHAHASTDDYCSVIVVRDRGFWEAARYWYDEWTGRYVSIGMMNVTPLAMDSRTIYAALPIAINIVRDELSASALAYLRNHHGRVWY